MRKNKYSNIIIKNINITEQYEITNTTYKYWSQWFEYSSNYTVNKLFEII